MYKVYYTDPVDEKCYSWDEQTLEGALSITEHFRKLNMRFVTMVSEIPNCVTKPGVDAVVEGTLPNGLHYTWKKRRIQLLRNCECGEIGKHIRLKI